MGYLREVRSLLSLDFVAGIIKVHQEVTPSVSRRYLLKLPHNCAVASRTRYSYNINNRLLDIMVPFLIKNDCIAS